MEPIRVGSSCIYYDKESRNDNIYNYEQYILQLIKRVCVRHPATKVNIYFSGNPKQLVQYTRLPVTDLNGASHRGADSNIRWYKNNTETETKTENPDDPPKIFISFNSEHMLVLPGGRDSASSVTGITKSMYDDGRNYLVRIDNHEFLKNLDIIIDYSIPNIVHVKGSRDFDDFTRKHVYIAPTLYNNLSLPPKDGRTVFSLTTFTNTNDRRGIFLQRMNKLSFRQHTPNGVIEQKHLNVTNCYDSHQLCELYKRTCILINIHQTDHHHTLEELRVLPALQCGVIVISEMSPLYQEVPYHDSIIWTTFENIAATVKEVFTNYDKYYEEIFMNKTPKTLVTLSQLDDTNYSTLEERILSAAA